LRVDIEATIIGFLPPRKIHCFKFFAFFTRF